MSGAVASVTVVIPHYYNVRAGHLQVILTDLSNGTVCPERVVVWNNDLIRPAWGVEHATVADLIQSPVNLGPQARFLAALTVTTNEVLFLDNDTTVRPDTLSNLLDYRRLWPGAILTLEGRVIKGGPYKHWPKIYGHGIEHARPLRVDMSLGRGELVQTRLLPRLLSRFPFHERLVMDDLWFSGCAAAGVSILVVPAVKGASDLGDLPRYGTGYSATPDYYAQRDATVAEIRRRLGVWGGEAAADATEVPGVGYV